MIPIVQFWHPSRPRIDYREMEGVFACNLDLRDGDNRYLKAIKERMAGWDMSAGMIVLEQDVAVDPNILSRLAKLIAAHPGSVCAVPYILWQASTAKLMPEWSWGYDDGFGRRRSVPPWDAVPDIAPWFALGCTYLPRVLIEAAPDTEQSWDYPVLACRLSELAARLGIACYHSQFPAVHLHWKKSSLCP